VTFIDQPVAANVLVNVFGVRDVWIGKEPSFVTDTILMLMV
jgi:hypothetical protein